MGKRHSGVVLRASGFKLWLWLVTSFSLLLGANGQNLRITDVQITPDGRFTLQHTADPASYYILRRGEQVTAILTAKDLGTGTGGTVQLRDHDPAPDTAFYRVQQVPLASPLDTDGDGLDDVYELRRRSFLVKGSVLGIDYLLVSDATFQTGCAKIPIPRISARTSKLGSTFAGRECGQRQLAATQAQ